MPSLKEKIVQFFVCLGFIIFVGLLSLYLIGKFFDNLSH